MRLRKYKRQTVLLLVAVLLPAAAFVGLAFRVIQQNRELSTRREADERARRQDQVRRELSSRLSDIEAEEVNRSALTKGQSVSKGSPNPAVVFVGEVEKDRIRLPWDIRLETPAHEACAAQLARGHAFGRSGNKDSSAGVYRAMLSDCDATVDEDSVAYSLHAARALLDAQTDSQPAIDYVVQEAAGTRWRSPAHLQVLSSLLELFPANVPRPIGQVTWQIQRAEQLAQLARDFPSVQERIAGAGGFASREPVWLAYGIEPWLVTVTTSSPTSHALVLVVSSHQLAPNNILIAGDAPEALALGGNFVNVSAQWLPGQSSRLDRQISAPLLIAGLMFIVGIMSVVGYLLLRDVNREVSTAELRTHFVADVSHEIKTPLTAIRLYADKLALGPSLDERVRSEYVDTIINESERLSRLVDNVLEFSKIESGTKIYRMAPASMEQVVESAARAVGYLFSQKGFTLSVSIAENMPAVAVDSDALQQAVLNLLDNAMKYSGESRRIELSLRRAGTEAVIAVSDSGVGIAPEEQAKIFDKFYRVRTAETVHIGGAGLGLALVHYTAAKHGGRVTVESAVGKGSTFSIHLPVGGV